MRATMFSRDQLPPTISLLSSRHAQTKIQEGAGWMMEKPEIQEGAGALEKPLISPAGTGLSRPH